MNKTKKWLGLGLSVLSVSVLVACGSSNSQSNNSSKETKTEKIATTEKSSEKKSAYAIGDKIVFDKPDKVLKVTYNVKNLSDKDLAVGVDINLFVGGNKMESYPNTNTMGSISPGRSMEGAVQHFGVKGDGKLELEIKPFTAFNEKPAIVAFDAP